MSQPDMPVDAVDHMTVVMQQAAEARGIATDFELASFSERNAKPRRWLRFVIQGQEYLFASGILLERGRDRWGRLGRHINDRAAVLIAGKHETKEFLARRGFSVPPGKLFRRNDLDAAFRAFDTFDGPICVKPNHGSKGRCVVTDIRDRDQYETAIRRVAEQFHKIVVEDSVAGDSFRFFYVEPRVVGIRFGRPANVTGDGRSSLAELIEAENADRRRRGIPTRQPIALDAAMRGFLAQQGRDLQEVPAVSERVFLRATGNASSGADTILYKDEVHPSYAKVVAQACAAIPGLHFTGVDIVIRDKTQPAAPGNHWLLELNASPTLTTFYYPWEGEAVDVAGLILDFLATRSDRSEPSP